MSILGEPKVLDGLVPGCNTAAAPPSSARCRARRGTKLPGVSDRCRAHLLRHRVEVVPRRSCACHGRRVAAAAQRAGIDARHQDLLNAIAFACMAALGRPCRRITHAQSFGINEKALVEGKVSPELRGQVRVMMTAEDAKRVARGERFKVPVYDAL